MPDPLIVAVVVMLGALVANEGYKIVVKVKNSNCVNVQIHDEHIEHHEHKDDSPKHKHRHRSGVDLYGMRSS